MSSGGGGSCTSMDKMSFSQIGHTSMGADR